MSDQLLSEPRLAAVLNSWHQWCRFEPTFVREISGGLTNRSFLIGTEKQHYVVRLNAANSASLGLDRVNEQKVQALASEAGLSPAVLHCDVRKGWLITQYISGKSLLEYNQWTPEDIHRFAELLKTIHSLPPISAPLDWEDKAHFYLQALPADTADVFKKIHAQARRMHGYFRRAREQCVQQTLCHNDLLVQNFLVDDKGGLWVIDWEYAAVGDPYFDLAALSQGFSQDQTALLLEAYQGERATSHRSRLADMQVIYRYIELLWYAVQWRAHQRLDFLSIIDRKLDGLFSDPY
jgi:thiamine kinase